jgi:tetratricopeptide (TPR) repeat protein
MPGFQKRLLVLSAALAIGIGSAAAQPAGPEPEPKSDAERLEELFAELAEPGRDDFERIEGEIVRIWSKSGSDSMDLLLQRGNEALENEDYEAALDHFSALTDHAPDFAEGWNGRATAFYLMGEYSLSISDVEHVLALNPRHFGALQGLAFMFEQMGEEELALRALKAVQSLNPNRPNIKDAIIRLERLDGSAEL